MPVRSFGYFYTLITTWGPSMGIISILIPTTMTQLLSTLLTRTSKGYLGLSINPCTRMHVHNQVLNSALIFGPAVSIPFKRAPANQISINEWDGNWQIVIVETPSIRHETDASCTIIYMKPSVDRRVRYKLTD